MSRAAAVTLEQVRGSAVVFYTPPVVVTSPGRLPNDIERLRGMLRDFCLEEIRREEQPRLEAATSRGRRPCMSTIAAAA